MEYVLNTSTGTLHKKECADGLTGLEPVKAGRRKHHSSYENAINDPQYKKDHNHPDCLGE